MPLPQRENMYWVAVGVRGQRFKMGWLDVGAVQPELKEPRTEKNSTELFASLTWAAYTGMNWTLY